MSDRATSLNLNNSNIGHSVVNLWMLRLLCNGDLWAKVARNDMYSHDALPKFFWGLKLRRHLHLGALILNNEKFLGTGAVKDIKAFTDVEMELDEDAVIAPEKRIRYLIEEVWPQYNFIDGLMPFLTAQPRHPETIGAYCRPFLGHPFTAKLLENGMPRALSRELRYLESACSDELSALPEAFAANLRLLQENFKLSDLETRILAFVYCARDVKLVNQLLCDLFDYGEQGMTLVIDTLSLALNADREDVKKALAAEGKLVSIGLLDYGESGDEFCEQIVPGAVLSPSTLSVKLSLSKLLQESFLPAPEPTLSVEHFPHLPIVSRVLLPYLKSAVAGKRKGVNILFYGPPGSGKTELTRVIAKELGLTGYEVQFAEKETRKKEERTSRLKFWKAAGNVLSQTNTNLLVIDEAEDVFNDLGSFFFSGRTNKGEINRLLEENPVVTLWTANSIHHIDPAMLRRFNMVIEVKSPGLAYRREMIDKAFDHRLSKGTTERLALTENLSSAVIRSISDIVRETGKTSESPSEDEIIEIGAVLFEDGEPSKVLSTLVNPSLDINPAAMAVNGITMQMVRNSPSQEEAAELLDAFLSEAKAGQVPIVGHNVRFDLGFLEALWRRHLGCSYSIEAFDTTRLLLPMKNRSSSYSVRVSTTGFPFTLTDLTGRLISMPLLHNRLLAANSLRRIMA